MRGFTLYIHGSSQLNYEMICSLKTYVLDVVGGSCEGKPTSSEGTCVRGELWRMLWFAFKTLHKCESNFTPRGKGYSSSQLLWEGIWTMKERWRRVLTSPYQAFVFRGLVISCCVERTNDWSIQIVFQLDFNQNSDDSLLQHLNSQQPSICFTAVVPCSSQKQC